MAGQPRLQVKISADASEAVSAFREAAAGLKGMGAASEDVATQSEAVAAALAKIEKSTNSPGKLASAAREAVVAMADLESSIEEAGLSGEKMPSQLAVGFEKAKESIANAAARLRQFEEAAAAVKVAGEKATTALGEVETAAKETGKALEVTGEKGKEAGAEIAAAAQKVEPALLEAQAAAKKLEVELESLGRAESTKALESGAVRVQIAFEDFQVAAKAAGMATETMGRTVETALSSAVDRVERFEQAFAALGDKAAATGTEAAAGLQKIEPVLTEVEAAAKALEVELEKLGKADTARGLIQASARAKVALDEYEEKAKSAGVATEVFANRVKNAEEKIQAAAVAARKHADAVGDLTTRGNIAAQGMEALAGKAGSLEGMLSLLKDTGGTASGRMADIGFAALGAAGAIGAAVMAGKQLGEWIDQASTKYEAFAKQQEEAKIKVQTFGYALASAKQGHIDITKVVTEAKEAVAAYMNEQEKNSETTGRAANIARENLALMGKHAVATREATEAIKAKTAADITDEQLLQALEKGQINFTAAMESANKELGKYALSTGHLNEEARKFITQMAGMDLPTVKVSQMAVAWEAGAQAIKGAYQNSKEEGDLFVAANQKVIDGAIGTARVFGREVPQALLEAQARLRAIMQPLEDFGAQTVEVGEKAEVWRKRIDAVSDGGSRLEGFLAANKGSLLSLLPQLHAVGQGYAALDPVMQAAVRNAMDIANAEALKNKAMSAFAPVALNYKDTLNAIQMQAGVWVDKLASMEQGNEDWRKALIVAQPVMAKMIEDFKAAGGEISDLPSEFLAAARAAGIFAQAAANAARSAREMGKIQKEATDASSGATRQLAEEEEYLQNVRDRTYPGIAREEAAIKERTAARAAERKALQEADAVFKTLDWSRPFASAALATSDFQKSLKGVELQWEATSAAASASTSGFREVTRVITEQNGSLEDLVEVMTRVQEEAPAMSVWVEPLITDLERGKVTLVQFNEELKRMQQAANLFSAWGVGLATDYQKMLRDMALAQQEYFDKSEKLRKEAIKKAQEDAIKMREAWYADPEHRTTSGMGGSSNNSNNLMTSLAQWRP